MQRRSLNILLAEVSTNKLDFAGQHPKTGEPLRINLGPVDTNLDKPTQMLIASALHQQLPSFGYDPTIAFFDGKALPLDLVGKNPGGTPYLRYDRSIAYASGEILVQRLGMGLEVLGSLLREFPVLGLTNNFTFETNRVLEVIATYRQWNPGGKVAVGGRDATFRPEVYLRGGADAVVLGEGEQIAGKLIAYLHEGRRIDFPGVAFREGETLHGLGQRQLRAPINELPLPHFFTAEESLRPDLPGPAIRYWVESQDGPFPAGVQPPTYHFFTSRGCIFDCSFCTTSTQTTSGGYDAMRPENFARLLAYLKENGVRTLLSAEDAVMERVRVKKDGRDGRRELAEMMRTIREGGFSVEWPNALNFGLFHDGTRVESELVDIVFRHELAPDGRWTGTYRSSIPVERPGGDLRLRKLKTHDINLEVLSAIAQRLPSSLGLCMIFRPEDTLNQLKRMELYQKELQHAIVQASDGRVQTRLGAFCLMPHPGTEDSRLESLAAYPIGQFPELRHYFAPVLDGQSLGGLSHQELFGEMLDIKMRLDPASYRRWLEVGGYEV